MSAQRAQEDEEDASQLKLGPEFMNARCLMMSEVAIVLEKYQEQQAEQETNPAANPVFEKCLQYCKRFNRFENHTAVSQVRELLSSAGLSEYEVGAIGNLVPENAQEAKVLIPSLEEPGRLAEDEIEAMLRTLGTYKTLQ
mmetsp:Transcript_38368/g.46288  ORF Transcript_38368/g.46288 Transcript_38368/m.46288 type:complete len:140 (+) Transcript_38368:202-621(+)|eukprot:CAMPEP_0197854188 /NCGR_PEP_ID=MMETSP1438-20131217/24177_1 /TAXON_ID=1461541 /ORGANISM="Pterosperma sp., Strain CCMP1384" /LENGTH=139 /DNA_ID=CAMNT_0043468837 /DNA_START=190 /DNA_END=609 /DNA_ORIENTATION=+